MKFVIRIFYFVSIFLLFIIFRELSELVVLTFQIHQAVGYATLLLLLAFIIYFIGIPVARIIKIPKNFAPTRDAAQASTIVESRCKKFRNNPFLLSHEFDFDTPLAGDEAYDRIIEVLQAEGEQIRKRYVLQLFYSSSISQNGFLDAILILSSSVNLVKELFVLYHGRVSNKDLLAIAKHVYLSMAIGGSEGVEYATQEFFSKFATDSAKSIPFADKIFGSLADGFVNAALLTRISLITENYCTKVLIESEKDLYPSSEFIIQTTKFITSDIFEKMTVELLRMSKEKTADYVMMAVNPVAHVFSRTLGMVGEGTHKITSFSKEMIKDVTTVANKPFAYGVDKLTGIFKKKTA